ncbi:hypothetical protein MTX78_18240 [Hymenobacter tibetensis]|uniref:Outer membrane protein beta-barrel domain-containing protein n=1 Tax=Hymenobacter tibetensis TaxID=497967 RepID=A0ABY4CUV7_9BACT|nr:hypothetical protein [Hymenobacter tibetensis]UOG74050.1 hypothetical protein MTX78_18240 [Hymenobacter tibetensis]
MKKTILVPLLLGLAGPVAAQHTEYNGRAGLGLFRFSGQGAASVSTISYYNDYLSTGPNGFASNSYGREVGTGFMVGGRMQHVGSHNGLFALDIGYDRMRSQAAVNQVDYSSSLFSSFRSWYPADGTIAIITQNLTAFLGAGHRFQVGTVNLDLLAGPEAAYVFGVKQKGSGSFEYNNGTSWKINQSEVIRSRGDVRLHAEVTAWYEKIGVTAGYSYGLINYQGGLYGSDAAVYSRTLRLGMTYRVR